MRHSSGATKFNLGQPLITGAAKTNVVVLITRRVIQIQSEHSRIGRIISIAAAKEQHRCVL
jgi:hypothetical protein